MSKILNRAQAAAAYSAMCALNNVSARLDVEIPIGGGISTRIWEGITGHVFIDGEFRGIRTAAGNFPSEIYRDQNAFSTAYGLGEA